MFRAGDHSTFITGQTLTVDGGLTSVWNQDLASVLGEVLRP